MTTPQRQTTNTLPSTSALPEDDDELERRLILLFQQVDEIHVLAYKLDQFMAKMEVLFNSPLILAMLPPELAATMVAEAEAGQG